MRGTIVLSSAIDYGKPIDQVVIDLQRLEYVVKVVEAKLRRTFELKLPVDQPACQCFPHLAIGLA